MLITTILSATIAVLLLILSFRVIASRRETETSLGAGDNLRLERRIRAQANLTEYAPIFIILIGLAEMQDGSDLVLSLISALFVAGRVLHGYALSFSDKSPVGRIVGMVATFAALGLAAGFSLFIALS
ncbi:MAG: MAPEG family protein [Pseudomonadota bacterium]